MRLSAWQVVVPVAIAIVLLTGVTLHASAPVSCADAKENAEHGLLSQANKAYLAILAEDASKDCAAKGLKAVADKLCAKAAALRNAGATEEAKKTYVAVLTEEIEVPAGCTDHRPLLRKLLAPPKQKAEPATCPCSACR